MTDARTGPDPDLTADLTPGFAQLVDDFAAMAGQDKLELLLEVADELPGLPQRYADHPELLEPVPECQSPIFLIAEVEGAGADGVVRLHFSAPPEAPTTRGFASILHTGLDGRTVAEVLGTPDDLPNRFGLAQLISPLRLRGMAGMLGRVKRQVSEKS